MTVYVDDMYKHAHGKLKQMKMSHMIADQDEELHFMATKIGMKKSWHQGDHYDISLSKRKMAIELGAISVSQKQIAAMKRRKSIEGHCGNPDEAIQWFLNFLKNKRN